MPSPPSLPASLVELARAHGVATDFTDWQGRPATVPEQTVRAVLAALDVPAADQAETEASLRATRDREWRRTLPPTVVTVQGIEQQVPVHAPPTPVPGARVLLESGEERVLPAPEGPGEQRQAVARWTLRLPADLPLGWHRLEVTGTSTEPAGATLVVTPARLEVDGQGADAADQRWGVMTQLYAMRSQWSWGLGDLADLGDLGAWAAGLGADFVLVNPLHAAEPVPPMEPSPYLPTTRRFVNPVYVRVEEVPEVAYLSAAERQLVEWHADDARRYLDLDQLERDAVWRAKEGALRLVFKQRRSVRRERAFQAFCEREGQQLLDFATWCALVARHGRRWRDWPAELHDPRGPAVARAREELAGEVEFYCWLQWVLADQLSAVQRDLLDTGMRLGVVHDLAVGVHPDGADSWMLGDALARGVTVGAPPDQYNQRGQDWSQPPWRPDRLAELGYAPYRAMLRAVLRDAGGLRVDHVMGLFRLWWVPDGSSPERGTYVRYDHEAMVGILLLEAHRAGALVVGEDLGTVEPWVRDYLADRAVLGTSIVWFERTEDGPLPAEEYRELCLATVTTHDLPPTAGYLTGEHIRLRAGLGLLTRPEEVERAEDEAAREEVLALLRDRGLLAEDASVADQVAALHRYLTRTPARLLGVSVSDLAQDRRIINQPGTADEYPNWRVPLAGPEGRPLLLEELFARRSARRLARTVTRQG